MKYFLFCGEGLQTMLISAATIGEALNLYTNESGLERPHPDAAKRISDEQAIAYTAIHGDNDNYEEVVETVCGPRSLVLVGAKEGK